MKCAVVYPLVLTDFELELLRRKLVRDGIDAASTLVWYLYRLRSPIKLSRCDFFYTKDNTCLILTDDVFIDGDYTHLRNGKVVPSGEHFDTLREFAKHIKEQLCT